MGPTLCCLSATLMSKLIHQSSSFGTETIRDLQVVRVSAQERATTEDWLDGSVRPPLAIPEKVVLWSCLIQEAQSMQRDSLSGCLGAGVFDVTLLYACCTAGTSASQSSELEPSFRRRCFRHNEVRF